MLSSFLSARTDLVTSSAAGPWASGKPHGSTAAAASAPTASRSRRGRLLRSIPAIRVRLPFATAQTFRPMQTSPSMSAPIRLPARRTATVGTSFAAPMWAGYIALVNQQLANGGKGPIGFINPTIYAQNASASTYAADFHTTSRAAPPAASQPLRASISSPDGEAPTRV